MTDEPITEAWCRKHLEDNGYQTNEDNVAVEFIIAKCSNGSDAMIAFNTFRPSQKDVARCFVSNFYVSHIKTVGDLLALVSALGFADNVPWTQLRAAMRSEPNGGNNDAN